MTLPLYTDIIFNLSGDLHQIIGRKTEVAWEGKRKQAAESESQVIFKS